MCRAQRGGCWGTDTRNSHLYFTSEERRTTFENLFRVPLAGGTIEHVGKTEYLLNLTSDGQDLFFSEIRGFQDGYVGKLPPGGPRSPPPSQR
jgi:hypothetical protein